MATEHSHTQFIGVDKLPLFPQDIRPANVTFKEADVLAGLPFEDNSFDLIQMRLFLVTFNRTQYIESLNEIYRLLKPGGFVQLVEPQLMVLICTKKKILVIINNLLFRIKAMILSKNTLLNVNIMHKKTKNFYATLFVVKIIMEYNDYDSEVSDHLSILLDKTRFITKESLRKGVPLGK